MNNNKNVNSAATATPDIGDNFLIHDRKNNDQLILLQGGKNNVYPLARYSPSMDDDLLSFLKYYEQRMINYIYEVPHTPPTLFELRIKHKQVKNDTIEMYGKNSENRSAKNDLERLEHYIELSFNSIIDRSIKEYRLCQTGFIIGWKDSRLDNRTATKIANPVDDRF